VFFSLTITKTKIFVNEGKSFPLTKTKTKVYMKLKRNSENENDIVLNELNQEAVSLEQDEYSEEEGHETEESGEELEIASDGIDIRSQDDEYNLGDSVSDEVDVDFFALWGTYCREAEPNRSSHSCLASFP
jgi:hypothetical protein